MATSHLDTLKMAERLEGTGVPAEQARMHALLLSEALDEAMRVEKTSIAECYVGKTEFCDVKVAIEKLDAKIVASTAELKSELIHWVVSVGILQFALISGLLLKLVH
jgi:hypothetical protein